MEKKKAGRMGKKRHKRYAAAAILGVSLLLLAVLLAIGPAGGRQGAGQAAEDGGQAAPPAGFGKGPGKDGLDDTEDGASGMGADRKTDAGKEYIDISALKAPSVDGGDAPAADAAFARQEISGDGDGKQGTDGESVPQGENPASGSGGAGEDETPRQQEEGEDETLRQEEEGEDETPRQQEDGAASADLQQPVTGTRDAGGIKGMSVGGTNDIPAGGIKDLPAGSVVEKSVLDASELSDWFTVSEIPDSVYERIRGRSFQENTKIKREDLRYIKVLHYNFGHEPQVGELIADKDVAEEFRQIFMELYEAQYEIQSMYLIDRYWAGNGEDTDTASVDANNTSAFFYRTVSGTSRLSRHAYGRAIDINPQQNPYVSYATGEPVWDHENANDYIDRSSGAAHMITKDDVCYKIFTKYGYTWGGSWKVTKDYQHFEKK